MGCVSADGQHGVKMVANIESNVGQGEEEWNIKMESR